MIICLLIAACLFIFWLGYEVRSKREILISHYGGLKKALRQGARIVKKYVLFFTIQVWSTRKVKREFTHRCYVITGQDHKEAKEAHNGLPPLMP